VIKKCTDHDFDILNSFEASRFNYSLYKNAPYLEWPNGKHNPSFLWKGTTTIFRKEICDKKCADNDFDIVNSFEASRFNYSLYKNAPYLEW
jgi:hypothetical protein